MSENTVTPILFVEAVNSYSNFAFVIPFSNPASRRWMHFHGVSPDICCDVWKRLDVVNTMAAEGINGGSGACHGPPQYYCGNCSLGEWIDSLRALKKKLDTGKNTYLTHAHVHRLDEVGMVWGGVNDVKWQSK
uniref:Uncharacterized protein n=1 Tax=Skeletonema marinoi TaxID=267567 RepID=A0A6U3YXZ2_9STRA|mmetsp:Transcript_5805/g.9689  ORF Transcript_5805/g.9689 Transcript_5805/m.9689 type:complete len:133 (+) Transcript_5805:197-595(+)